MKITLRRRLTIPVGLLLLALLVSAIAVQAVQARPTRLAVAARPALANPGASQIAAARNAVSVLEHQGASASAIAAAGARVVQLEHQYSTGFGAQAPAVTTQSGSFSTTAWILVGLAVALLVVGVTWALVRRRPRRAELSPASYCAVHPDDPLCGTA
jgi:hypothetical protein